MEFVEARLLSAKKALYLELMLQLTLYLFMCISAVDWSGLLIVLAAYYLDAKRWNFLLMYLVLVTISILFDLVHAASLPSFEHNLLTKACAPVFSARLCITSWGLAA